MLACQRLGLYQGRAQESLGFADVRGGYGTALETLMIVTVEWALGLGRWGEQLGGDLFAVGASGRN